MAVAACSATESDIDKEVIILYEQSYDSNKIDIDINGEYMLETETIQDDDHTPATLMKSKLTEVAPSSNFD
jgi:hypothetical protein